MTCLAKRRRRPSPTTWAGSRGLRSPRIVQTSCGQPRRTELSCKSSNLKRATATPILSQSQSSIKPLVLWISYFSYFSLSSCPETGRVLSLFSGKLISVPRQQRRVSSSTLWAYWAAVPKPNASASILESPNRYEILIFFTFVPQS